MLRQGFVLLSDADADAPQTPAVATVSKDDSWDHGGLAIGEGAAAQGRLWVDRPYFTGQPGVDWLVARLNRATGAGGYAQIGNEQNVGAEGWPGGVGAWFAYEDRVRAAAAHPERLLAMPPSPGVADWQAWVRPAGHHACHAYGSFAEMRDVVAWFLANTAGEVHVTECNFAAGRTVDVDAWANAELLPFLDWCSGQPRVASVAYFAWRWDQSASLPTSVDARGTAVETVVRDWRPPAAPIPPEEPMTNPWERSILTVWNCPADPAELVRWGETLHLDGFELKTADGDSSWLDAPERHLTPAYVAALRAGGRFRVMGWSYNYCDLVIGDPNRGNGVPEREAAAAARGVDELGLDGHTFDLEIECEGHADLTAILLAEARRLMPSTPFGAHTWAERTGHERYPWEAIGAGVDVVRPMIYRPTWTAADTWSDDELGPWLEGKVVCPVLGITDAAATTAALAEDASVALGMGAAGLAFWERSGLPGQPGVADWIAALDYDGGAPAPGDLARLQQRTWDALDAVQALAGEWDAAGWPSTGSGIGSAAESAKSLVRASKGER